MSNRSPGSLAGPMLLGGLSALLFSSMMLGFAFLVPVQAARGRFGYRGLGVAAAAAALGICAVQAGVSIATGAQATRLAFLGLLPPLVMLGALAAVNARAAERLGFVARMLAAGAAIALATAPTLAAAAAEPALKELFASFMSRLLAQGGAEALGSAELDTLWAVTVRVMGATFGAAVFCMFAGSVWLGSRFPRRDPSAPDAEGRSAVAPALADYRVPLACLWPLFASWGAILLMTVMSMKAGFPYPRAGRALEIVSWNAAITLSICYALQGFSVLGALSARLGLGKAAKFGGILVVALVLAGGVAGTVLAAVLALLGILETWVPFRISKGVEP